MPRLLAALLLLMLPALAAAQPCGTRDLIAELDAGDKAKLDALVAPHAYSEGILFRAEKPGSRVTVIGTMHIPDPRLDGLVAQVRDAVEAADLLILEATTADQAALQAMAATRPEVFFLTEGPTLIDLLGEEDWRKVTERLAPLGIPGFFAAKFKPWYLSMTLSIPPCIVTAMAEGGKGFDARLEEIAAGAGVPIATLDDVAALLDLLAGDPLEEQLEGLRLALEMQSDARAMTSTMIERYFEGKVRETWEFGRIEAVESELGNAEALFDAMDAALLVGRNRGWEPEIHRLVAGKDAVLAVGAAHLSGESGVLRALERAGYTITRL